MRSFVYTFLVLGLFLPGVARAQGDSYLGIVVEEADRGVLVTEVVPGSPAAKAGLKVGDLIISFGGKRVGEMDAFVDSVLAMKAGQKLDLAIRRGDATRRITATLGHRRGAANRDREAEEKAEAKAKAKAKARAAEQEAKRKAAAAKRRAAAQRGRLRGVQGKQSGKKGFLGVYLQGDEGGVSVTGVIAGSPAQKVGLRSGDRIVGVNEKRIADLEGFVDSIANAGAGTVLNLRVRRGGKEFNLRPRLTTKPSEVPEPMRVETKPHPKEAPKARTRPAPKAMGWMTNYKKAAALAKQTRRPLVIDFYADWCPPCKMLEETFASDQVKAALRGAVTVKVDVDKHEALADEFHVDLIPHVAVLDANGKKLGKIVGYRPAGEFAKAVSGLLHRHAARTAPKTVKKARPPRRNPKQRDAERKVAEAKRMVAMRDRQIAQLRKEMARIQQMKKQMDAQLEKMKKILEEIEKSRK